MSLLNCADPLIFCGFSSNKFYYIPTNSHLWLTVFLMFKCFLVIPFCLISLISFGLLLFFSPPHFSPPALCFLLLPLYWDAVMYLFATQLLPYATAILWLFSPPSPLPHPLLPSHCSQCFCLPSCSQQSISSLCLGPPFGEGGRPPS